jgi:hypothetical protein
VYKFLYSLSCVSQVQPVSSSLLHHTYNRWQTGLQVVMLLKFSLRNSSYINKRLTNLKTWNLIWWKGSGVGVEVDAISACSMVSWTGRAGSNSSVLHIPFLCAIFLLCLLHLWIITRRAWTNKGGNQSLPIAYWPVIYLITLLVSRTSWRKWSWPNLS